MFGLKLGRRASKHSQRLFADLLDGAGRDVFLGLIEAPKEIQGVLSGQAPPAHWTASTTIEVSLVVTEGNLTSGGDTAAWFDGISLVPHDGDVIFQDGFDP